MADSTDTELDMEFARVFEEAMLARNSVVQEEDEDAAALYQGVDPTLLGCRATWEELSSDTGPLENDPLYCDTMGDDLFEGDAESPVSDAIESLASSDRGAAKAPYKVTPSGSTLNFPDAPWQHAPIVSTALSRTSTEQQKPVEMLRTTGVTQANGGTSTSNFVNFDAQITTGDFHEPNQNTDQDYFLQSAADELLKFRSSPVLPQQLLDSYQEPEEDSVVRMADANNAYGTALWGPTGGMFFNPDENFDQSFSDLYPSDVTYGNSIGPYIVPEEQSAEGLGGLFGLTLDQAQAGVRNKKAVKPQEIAAHNIVQYSGVQKTKPKLKASKKQVQGSISQLAPKFQQYAGDFQRESRSDTKQSSVVSRRVAADRSMQQLENMIQIDTRDAMPQYPGLDHFQGQMTTPQQHPGQRTDLGQGVYHNEFDHGPGQMTLDTKIHGLQAGFGQGQNHIVGTPEDRARHAAFQRALAMSINSRNGQPQKPNEAKEGTQTPSPNGAKTTKCKPRKSRAKLPKTVSPEVAAVVDAHRINIEQLRRAQEASIPQKQGSVPQSSFQQGAIPQNPFQEGAMQHNYVQAMQSPEDPSQMQQNGFHSQGRSQLQQTIASGDPIQIGQFQQQTNLDLGLQAAVQDYGKKRAHLQRRRTLLVAAMEENAKQQSLLESAYHRFLLEKQQGSEQCQDVSPQSLMAPGMPSTPAVSNGQPSRQMSYTKQQTITPSPQSDVEFHGTQMLGGQPLSAAQFFAQPQQVAPYQQQFTQTQPMALHQYSGPNHQISPAQHFVPAQPIGSSQYFDASKPIGSKQPFNLAQQWTCAPQSASPQHWPTNQQFTQSQPWAAAPLYNQNQPLKFSQNFAQAQPLAPTEALSDSQSSMATDSPEAAASKWDVNDFLK